MLGLFSVRRNKIALDERGLMQALEGAQFRQKGLCACCGIGIPVAVGPAFRNGDASDCSEENLAAVCKACEALHNGGRLNAQESCGYLIYLPDLPQVEVIRMAYAAQGLMINVAGTDRALMTSLSSLRTDEINKLKLPVEKYLGLSDADALSDFLRAATPAAYKARGKGLGPVKWMPELAQGALRKYVSSYKASFATRETLEILGDSE